MTIAEDPACPPTTVSPIMLLTGHYLLLASLLGNWGDQHGQEVAMDQAERAIKVLEDRLKDQQDEINRTRKMLWEVTGALSRSLDKHNNQELLQEAWGFFVER